MTQRKGKETKDRWDMIHAVFPGVAMRETLPALLWKENHTNPMSFQLEDHCGRRILEERKLDWVAGRPGFWMYLLSAFGSQRRKEEETSDAFLFKPDFFKVLDGCEVLREKYPAEESLAAAAHFAGKPDENLIPLVKRMQDISALCQDITGSALLAASYYSMEELRMRLPVLEAMLRNPFGEGKRLQEITSIIMTADGGPAEGAKAIQLYLTLTKEGINCMEPGMNRMIGLLAIAASRPAALAKELLSSARGLLEGDGFLAAEGAFEGLTECFFIAAFLWLLELLYSEEKKEELNPTAFTLFDQMEQEVRTILLAACLGI